MSGLLRVYHLLRVAWLGRIHHASRAHRCGLRHEFWRRRAAVSVVLRERSVELLALVLSNAVA